MEGQSADILSSLLPLVALFAIFYFLIIRPQQKQAKAHKDMIAGLKKGDKIVTNGGLIVEVVKVEETYFLIKNSDNSEMKLAKEFVAKCNKYGGNLPDAQGVPEDMLNYASKHGVAKINIDTDLRLAMTSTIREFFIEHPEKFDPREYMGPGRTAVKEMVMHKMRDVLGTAGHAKD